MTKNTLQSANRSKRSRKVNPQNESASNGLRRRTRKHAEKTDVLISAVISTHLLTHLHHVLQRAEFGAIKEGRVSQAANFAQLRKVLCMDARSMKDALAAGLQDGELDKFNDSSIGQKVA